jgi:hypothetical protein
MENSLFVNDSSGAVFSEDRKYRYYLWRAWDEKKPSIVFIGLNPSTANESKNDPTIRRVLTFAKNWGYGKVYMMNLFALVSPFPKDLLECPDPIAENDSYLKTICKGKDILFAWGAFKAAKDRAVQVVEWFPSATCLGINSDGSPKHPLYVPSKRKQVNFK